MLNNKPRIARYKIFESAGFANGKKELNPSSLEKAMPINTRIIKQIESDNAISSQREVGSKNKSIEKIKQIAGIGIKGMVGVWAGINLAKPLITETIISNIVEHTRTGQPNEVFGRKTKIFHSTHGDIKYTIDTTNDAPDRFQSGSLRVNDETLIILPGIDGSNTNSVLNIQQTNAQNYERIITIDDSTNKDWSAKGVQEYDQGLNQFIQSLNKPEDKIKIFAHSFGGLHASLADPTGKYQKTLFAPFVGETAVLEATVDKLTGIPFSKVIMAPDQYNSVLQTSKDKVEIIAIKTDKITGGAKELVETFPSQTTLIDGQHIGISSKRADLKYEKNQIESEKSKNLKKFIAEKEEKRLLILRKNLTKTFTVFQELEKTQSEKYSKNNEIKMLQALVHCEMIKKEIDDEYKTLNIQELRVKFIPK